MRLVVEVKRGYETRCASTHTTHAILTLPGVRLVVEVKRGYEARVVLNQLFKHTRLQSRFSCNMVRWEGEACSRVLHF